MSFLAIFAQPNTPILIFHSFIIEIKLLNEYL